MNSCERQPPVAGEQLSDADESCLQPRRTVVTCLQLPRGRLELDADGLEAELEARITQAGLHLIDCLAAPAEAAEYAARQLLRLTGAQDGAQRSGHLRQQLPVCVCAGLGMHSYRRNLAQVVGDMSVLRPALSTRMPSHAAACHQRRPSYPRTCVGMCPPRVGEPMTKPAALLTASSTSAMLHTAATQYAHACDNIQSVENTPHQLHDCWYDNSPAESSSAARKAILCATVQRNCSITSCFSVAPALLEIQGLDADAGLCDAAADGLRQRRRVAVC